MMTRLILSSIETPKEPLILPDSVQKANFAQAVDKLLHLDVQDMMTNLLHQALWVVIKLLIALLIYFIGRWIIRRMLRLLDLTFERRNVDVSLRTFLRNTLRAVFIIILLMVIVQTLGVNVTSLIALFSAATLAIGMALSGTAQNFAGGVMILLMKPYRVGDFIMAQNQSGTVREIKLFSTVINTPDNRTIYIPNNTIATSIIDNYTTAPLRRVEWKINIAYGDDPELARTAILDQLRGDSRILSEPAEAVVWLSDLGDSAVTLSVRAWVRNTDYWDVFFQHNERFYKELPAKGLHFPFPQMDLHLQMEPKTPLHDVKPQ